MYAIEFEMSYIKGDTGEVVTASTLRDLGMKIVRNLYIPYDGIYTEVDMLGISRAGLFIIENKNYEGKVLALDNKSKYWRVHSNCSVSSMLNPCEQNYLHKRAIEGVLPRPLLRVLGVNKESWGHLYDCVIFNDRLSKLRVCDKYRTKAFILRDFCEWYESIYKENISDEDVSKLYDFFKPYSDMSVERRLEHIAQLKGVL